MKVRDIATFIAFGAMIAVAVAYIASLGVRVGPPSDRTNVSMHVADINSLVVDSNVLLRGVQVGKVTDIHNALDGATIEFWVDGQYKVPVDSEVRLENLSALGESYIGLVPKSEGGPLLRDGQRIDTERVVAPASISQLASNVMRVLNGADPDALKRIVNETDTAIPDANTVLPNLARTSVLMRNVVADMHGSGKDLLDNFQTLLQNANWVGPLLADITPQLDKTGDDADRLFSGFQTSQARGAPEIHVLFNRFLDRIQKLLDTNGGDLKVLGTALQPKLKGIAGSLMNFDTGQILQNFMAQVPADGTVTLHVAVPRNK